MSKQLKQDEEKRSASDDPGDIKRGASGILLLIAVCGVLWLIASFGPKGADWLNAQTRKLSGVSTEKITKISTPPKPKTEKDDEDEDSGPKLETVKEAEVAGAAKESEADKPAPVVVEAVAIPSADSLSQVDNARQQIQEALGGPETADVRYIAFSDDEAKMIAAVKFLKSENPEKFVEIVFSRDEFGWYRSDNDTADSGTIIVRQNVAKK